MEQRHTQAMGCRLGAKQKRTRRRRRRSNCANPMTPRQRQMWLPGAELCLIYAVGAIRSRSSCSSTGQPQNTEGGTPPLRWPCPWGPPAAGCSSPGAYGATAVEIYIFVIQSDTCVADEERSCRQADHRCVSVPVRGLGGVSRWSFRHDGALPCRRNEGKAKCDDAEAKTKWLIQTKPRNQSWRHLPSFKP